MKEKQKMSVPVYNRQPNKLLVLKYADKIMQESIRISKKENLIPKKTSKILRDVFIDHARNVMYGLYIANDLNLNYPEEIPHRLQNQLTAKIELDRLLVDINFNIEYVNKGNIGEYSNLLEYINKERNLINRWMESDKSRINCNNLKKTTEFSHDAV